MCILKMKAFAGFLGGSEDEGELERKSKGHRNRDAGWGWGVRY